MQIVLAAQQSNEEEGRVNVRKGLLHERGARCRHHANQVGPGQQHEGCHAAK